MENVKNYRIDIIYESFIETFNKSTKNDLINFLNQNRFNSKFILISDYCIKANNKSNDVYSYVIIPGALVQSIVETIKEQLPNDYKDIRSLSEINKNALQLLPYLAINVIIPKKFKNLLCISKYDDKAKQEINDIINHTIKMLQLWITNKPEYKERYDKYILKYQKLLQETKNKNFNINLYLRSFFTSTIAAYIIHEIEKFSGAKTLGWGTDRDAMLSAYNGILYDNFMLQYNGFSKNDDEWIDTDDCEITFLQPNLNGENWYDELIRLPDFCAGALSTIPLKDEWNNGNILLTETQINKAKDVLKCINSHCINIILSHNENFDKERNCKASRINFILES